MRGSLAVFCFYFQKNKQKNLGVDWWKATALPVHASKSAVHPEACFDCNGINRRLLLVSLDAAGGRAGQPWALRLAAERGHVAALRALWGGHRGGAGW
jgi:hypothetical protein